MQNISHYFGGENLSQDPIHGYIPFSASLGTDPDEFSERDLIDSPWVQRLRQIHQLQTAWLVYPTAEHTRFQHSIGAMHLAGRAVRQFYRSLVDVCGDDGESLPSKPYLISLLRIAALLHDVGHGPFGHFFDAQFLSTFGLNHEKLGAEIIRRELAPLIRKIRRNPNGSLADGETLDPEQVAFLIVRPDLNKEKKESSNIPRWLWLLRCLFSGLYTVDNMDFVLRDAYMTGFSARAFDIDRLFHYSFFTPKGLTIHQKGFATLTRFIAVRAELFRSVYFHRTVRAADISLKELFATSRALFFPGSGGTGSSNPLENLDEYLRFTEWSLLVDVARWERSPDEAKRSIAPIWKAFLQRRLPWRLAHETTVLFKPGEREQTSIFADEETLKRTLMAQLSEPLPEKSVRIDIARHLHRPDAHLPTAEQNFLYDSATERLQHLDEEELFRFIPQSFRLCRVYTDRSEYCKPLAEAMQRLVNPTGRDDDTNM